MDNYELENRIAKKDDRKVETDEIITAGTDSDLAKEMGEESEAAGIKERCTVEHERSKNVRFEEYSLAASSKEQGTVERRKRVFLNLRTTTDIKEKVKENTNAKGENEKDNVEDKQAVGGIIKETIGRKQFKSGKVKENSEKKMSEGEEIVVIEIEIDAKRGGCEEET